MSLTGGLRFGWFGRILVALVVGISFVPFIIMVYIFFLDPHLALVNYARAWDQLADSVNIWLRVVNTMNGLDSAGAAQSTDARRP